MHIQCIILKQVTNDDTQSSGLQGKAFTSARHCEWKAIFNSHNVNMTGYEAFTTLWWDCFVPRNDGNALIGTSLRGTKQSFNPVNYVGLLRSSQ